MARPRNGSYVWITWLSKLMAGDTQCHWGAWFKAHNTDYKKMPSDFPRALWQVEHTKTLNELCDALKSEAISIFKKNKNKFTLKRGTMAIAGQPDLIVLDKPSHFTIYDVKTGQPRQSDIIQVLLYMASLSYMPLYKHKQLSGCVVYKDNRTPIPATAVDEAFNGQIKHFLNILDSETPPSRVPSHAECCYCEITSEDCSDRIENDQTQCADLPF
jgi:hypothetical protein